MRTFFLLGTLLMTTIAFVPSAAAGCGEWVCCMEIDDSGSGLIGIAKRAAASTWEWTCYEVDRSPHTLREIRDVACRPVGC